jgi:hypothetical protein
MAGSGTFYLNAGSLALATSVYTDAGLTTLAPDQWYSNGAIAREQVSGVLGAITNCACNLAQNILIRDFRIQNNKASSFTIVTANISTDTLGGTNVIITAGSTVVAAAATVTLLEPNLRLTSNLLVSGDSLWLNMTLAGNKIGNSYDWDLADNSFPIADAILEEDVFEFFDGTNTIINIPFAIIDVVPNNFDGYLSGRLTIGTP